jgi:hypothetical protein
MLGLTWRRVLSRLATSAFLLLLWVVAWRLLHGSILVSSVVGLIVSIVLWHLLLRPLSRTTLRVATDRIEQSDGPVIRRDEVERVNEYAATKVPGIEIIGHARPRWLRHYQIFVPAALPEYEEVKRVVREWIAPEEWHTFDGASR